MTKPKTETLFLLSFTTILVGYFMIWLPGPSAGLQFLGLEMGEWTKFFGLGVKRNWFYLPPITLALSMLFFTVGWANGRFQTWLFRGVAIMVSLLAFPALEDLLGPSRGEYFSRIAGIALVMLVTGLLLFLKGQQESRLFVGSRILMIAAGLVGLILPTLIYLEVRPFVSDLMKLQLGYGPGFWLNLVGHAAILLLAGWQLAKK